MLCNNKVRGQRQAIKINRTTRILPRNLSAAFGIGVIFLVYPCTPHPSIAHKLDSLLEQAFSCNHNALHGLLFVLKVDAKHSPMYKSNYAINWRPYAIDRRVAQKRYRMRKTIRWRGAASRGSIWVQHTWRGWFD